MYASEHGGGCCGITHIVGMPEDRGFTLEAIHLALEGAFDDGTIETDHLYEVVITDGQAEENPELAYSLTETGFQPVCRWRNANTGNILTKFVRIPNGMLNPLTQEQMPYQLTRPVPEPVVGGEEPVGPEFRPLVVGDRCEVINERSSIFGEQHAIARTRVNPDGTTSFNLNGRWLSAFSLRRL